MNIPKTTVIISTFNQPEWLRKVLWGYEYQTFKDFDIIIADDGSKDETRKMIEGYKQNSSLSIQHLWQEDQGFQKNRILNKALIKSISDYIIFTDGDCIPRSDFVMKHLELRQNNHALSGGYFKLPANISTLLTKEHIKSQDCFKKEWLLERGLKKTFKINKLTAYGLKEKLLNKFTTTKATFDGMNVSAWKSDLIEVNGFDERMGYGGEDREIGERLMNKGVKFKQARYSLICLHLHHDRPYVTNKGFDINKTIRKNTKLNKTVTTAFGINKE